ncbi:unnamed protein product, partial [Oppiella nova]
MATGPHTGRGPGYRNGNNRLSTGFACIPFRHPINYPINAIQYEWLSNNLDDSSPPPVIIRPNYKLIYTSHQFNESAPNGAYCSGWISVDSGPGRFLLCILPFLTLVATFNGVKGQLPP